MCDAYLKRRAVINETREVAAPIATVQLNTDATPLLDKAGEDGSKKAEK